MWNKRIEDEKRQKEFALQKIWEENKEAFKMAWIWKEENNRCSEELATSLGIQRSKKSHKLEEDWSMYDESKDEDDLEEIIFEDPHAEDLGDLELQDMKS